MKSILIEFEKNYNLLKNKKYENLSSNYSKKLFMLNRIVICRENTNHKGILKGITKFGKLLIKINDDYKEFSVGNFHLTK